MACIVQDADSGAIRALSGGVDFRQHQFNAALDGLLQPGSVLKPFVLLAALQSGVSIDQKYESKPLEIRLTHGQIWKVRNAGERYFGTISLADALVLSDNTVYVQLLLEIGPERVRHLLRLAGIDAKIVTPSLSTGAIGPGVSPVQVCSAFSAFSACGRFFPPQIV